jgi:hypothetical protein
MCKNTNELFAKDVCISDEDVKITRARNSFEMNEHISA